MRGAALALLVALLLAGCGGNSSARPGAAADGIADLTSVAQLRDAFNAHAGEPRLIVLASPT